MILPSPGIGTAILLFLLASCFWFSSLGLAEWRKKLADTGWFPEHLDDIRQIFRMAALFALILSTIALLPPIFDPLIPIAISAFVIVAIWSSRENLKDFAAGWLIQSEGQVKLGVTLKVDAFYGEVTRIGFRTTTLVDGQGQRMVVPNRFLVGNRIVIDNERWPKVELTLHIPSNASISSIHHLIAHTVRCSPWAAPLPIQIQQHDAGNQIWWVQARILALRFEEPFTAALREHVDLYCRNEEK